MSRATLWCGVQAAPPTHGQHQTNRLQHICTPAVRLRDLFVYPTAMPDLFVSCCAVLWRAVACRLPRLQTVSIKLTGCSTAGHWQLDPVLCQLNTHATGLCCLQLQLETDYTILSKMDIVEYKADYTGDAAWVSLGKMVSLTRLQLSFDEKVGGW